MFPHMSVYLFAEHFPQAIWKPLSYKNADGHSRKSPQGRSIHFDSISILCENFAGQLVYPFCSRKHATSLCLLFIEALVLEIIYGTNPATVRVIKHSSGGYAPKWPCVSVGKVKSTSCRKHISYIIKCNAMCFT